MAQSPGVEILERDLSLTVPTAGSSYAAFAGKFSKGPSDQPVLITSLQMFLDTFGKPDNGNFADWFQVKSFLDYSNTIYVARGIDRDGTAAKEDSTLTIAVDAEVGDEEIFVSNVTDLYEGQGIVLGNDTIAYIIDEIKSEELDPIGAPGVMTYSLVLAPSLSSAFTAGEKVYVTKPSTNAIVDCVKVGSIATITEAMYKPTLRTIANYDEFTNMKDVIPMAHTDSSLKFIAKDHGTLGNSYSVIVAGQTEFTATAEAIEGVNLAALFEYAPSNANQYAVLVYDATSQEIVEKFLVSVDPAEKDFANKTMYIEEVISRTSTYVNVIHVPGTKPETALISNKCRKFDLAYGQDGVIGKGEIIEQFEINFADKELIDIDIVIIPEIAHKEISDFCKNRADVIGYFGARFEDVVGVKSTVAVANLNTYITSTLNMDNKYVSFGGNYVMIYDKYSDKNRWINVAGMLAGLRAETSNAREPWYAAAGLNFGQLKNVIKIAQNFNVGQRDLLYKNAINCVVSFPGQGICLWGNKVLTQKPSAFSRVNTRMLFNYMERRIANMSKYVLFEQNTAQTRNLFVSSVKPFFERIQAAQGIEDFAIVCDESNNTAIVRQNNSFVADFYIKPAYSIEFITLRFSAVGAAVSFSEVIG